MESITLQQVLPDAFAGNPEPPKSDLWLHDVTFRKGEYYLVEAASGTGKSSLCSFLYGARTDYAGRILFDAADCRTLSVAQWGELRRRSLSMLFQDLRLFGELTVAENLALKNELTHFLTPDRIERLLEAAGIAGKRDTPAGKLSFGQQQRVALARALCIEPDVLLMDEPLSNLDAKLRVEMRTVIKNIQHNVGITTVYVTHDQEEAMAVSDRIAVMNAGVIQHVGKPKSIYQRPANLFVATFIGRSNVIKGKLVVDGGKTYLETLSGYRAEIHTVRPEQQKEQEITLSVRPEEFLLDRDSTEGISAIVDDCVFLGLNTHYFVHLSSGEEVEIIQESSIDSIIEPGSEIKLKINTDKVNLFTADGEENILTGVCNDCAKA